MIADRLVLIIGTHKGLFTFTSDHNRSRWQLGGPYLNGLDVTHATLDPRNGKLYATANDPWFGNRLAVSADLGASWQDGFGGPKFAAGAGKTVARLWRIEPGWPTAPGVLFCGVDPGALFCSEDGGETWLEEEALNDHPTRGLWEPGAGGLIVHSIVLDPVDGDRMWVAISAAGVFRTEDGGRSWQPLNSGLKNQVAKYEPNAELSPEVGQCVHHMVRAAGGGDRLYVQAHWGTYRSDDGAATWIEITEGLPSDFGLMIAAHPREADVAYVLPLQGAEFRCPPEGKLRVFRTTDGGRTWQPLTRGLPQQGAFMSGYREAMVCDSLAPAGVYFGTNTGQIYASADEGESWRRLTTDLPPISSLSAVILD